MMADRSAHSDSRRDSRVVLSGDEADAAVHVVHRSSRGPGRRLAVRSTSDVIEADTAYLAEQKAIEAWKALRPDRTFAPLLTVASQPEGRTP